MSVEIGEGRGESTHGGHLCLQRGRDGRRAATALTAAILEKGSDVAVRRGAGRRTRRKRGRPGFGHRDVCATVGGLKQVDVQAFASYPPGLVLPRFDSKSVRFELI